MGNTLSAYHETPHEVSIGEDGGRIKGLQLDSKARRYVGVPYALPPTGNRRWCKPCALPSSHSYTNATNNAPFDATIFGPICFQPNYSASVKKALSKNTFSEDCLRLNIWTPVPSDPTKDLSSEKWPVMLWLHGGWFQMGDPSHEAGMDPTELISTGKLNAIVVAIGYRLNLFGFLAGDALMEESRGNKEGSVCGNYGLWDQRMAMEWVYQNIASFGGDPDNITLGGRSAGAFAAQAHTLYDFQTAPSHLFRRLFMNSNAIPAQPKTPRECQPQFNELCMHFGIALTLPGPEKLRLLRDISAEDLTAAIMKLKHHTFRPVTEGEFLKPGLVRYLRDGSFAKIFQQRGFKLFIGEVLNEETLYAVTNGPQYANVEALALQVSNYYSPSTTSRVLEHYSMPSLDASVGDWKNLFGRIVSDGQVRAPSRFFADCLLQHGVSIQDVWRYRIAYRLSFITDKIAPTSFGVSHAMDKPFWNFSILHGPTIEERSMMEDWIADLKAFLHDDSDFEYGTELAEDFKVVTPEGKIEIRTDERWEELLELADIFSGASARSEAREVQAQL